MAVHDQPSLGILPREVLLAAGQPSEPRQLGREIERLRPVDVVELQGLLLRGIAGVEGGDGYEGGKERADRRGLPCGSLSMAEQ